MAVYVLVISTNNSVRSASITLEGISPTHKHLSEGMQSFSAMTTAWPSQLKRAKANECWVPAQIKIAIWNIKVWTFIKEDDCWLGHAGECFERSTNQELCTDTHRP